MKKKEPDREPYNPIPGVPGGEYLNQYPMSRHGFIPFGDVKRPVDYPVPADEADIGSTDTS